MAEPRIIACAKPIGRLQGIWRHSRYGKDLSIIKNAEAGELFLRVEPHTNVGDTPAEPKFYRLDID